MVIVIMHGVTMLNVIMLSVIMLSVIMLSVVLMCVVAPPLIVGSLKFFLRLSRFFLQVWDGIHQIRDDKLTNWDGIHQPAHGKLLLNSWW